MDIGINKKYTGLMLFLAVGFLIVGLSLIVLAWQNLKQQQDHVLDQLEVTGRAIIRSVEANLFRGVFRRTGPGRLTDEEFLENARDIFEELVAEGDVVFLDMTGPRGRLIISRYEGAADAFQPDEAMLLKAGRDSWKETAMFMDREVFILGIPARRAETINRSRRSVPEVHQGELHRVIFIALDMSDYLETYSGFRRTIILQTMFTLGGVLLFWLLLLAFLRKKEHRQKFIQLKSFHSRLLDNMPDGLLSVDRDNMVTAANPAARDILEAGADIVGKRLPDIMPKKLKMHSDKEWTQIENQGKSLEILFLPIREENQSLVLIRDRTRMKKLEKDLEHSRDLATLGRFAAGLAHEIRNPLSSLKGFAQYFLQKFSENDPAHSYARTMVQESDRLNTVVTDLLYLARPRPIRPVRIDIKEMFEEVVNILQSDLKAKRCGITIDTGYEHVQADRDLLKQALINLVLNSLNAVEEGKGKIILSSVKDRDMVKIAVVDNGSGMAPETRERAMEPFFSSRDKGTGLGLSIVQRIVRDHKGIINIDSDLAHGTEVSMAFPEYQGASDEG